MMSVQKVPTFIIFIVLCFSVCYSSMTLFRYTEMAVGSVVTGEVLPLETTSSFACSTSCSGDGLCKGYVFTEPDGCRIIRENVEASEELVASLSSKVYAREFCLSNPCFNGGICRTDFGSFYTCDCPVMYSGHHCETDLNECSPSSHCLNGGQCTDNVGYFTCECEPGFDGKLCETNIDHCEPRPCQNGATCEAGLLEFTCHCQQDNTGDLCELSCPESKTFAPSSTWTTQPDFYRDMSNINCATAPRGAVTFADGQVGKALIFDKAQKRYVDFGVVPGNCMPKPATCSGATLSVWLDVISCTGGEGILSTFVDYGEGISIECYNNNIQARASTTTQYGGTNGNYPNGWFHLVYVLHAPGQGMTMYIDGELESTTNTMENYGLNAGDGKLVVGRRQTVGDKLYSSFMIDELAFFSGQFNERDVTDLYQSYQD